MRSSIVTRCIRVESLLLALGILALIQLCMMGDEEPCTWIRWARLATALGVFGLGLGALALADHWKPPPWISEAPRGPPNRGTQTLR